MTRIVLPMQDGSRLWPAAASLMQDGCLLLDYRPGLASGFIFAFARGHVCAGMPDRPYQG